MTDHSAKAREIMTDFCSDVCQIRDARSCGCFAKIEAALLTAYTEGRESAAKVADGWQLVPKRPTEKMLGAGVGYTDFILPEGMPREPKDYLSEMHTAWHAMLEAAAIRSEPPAKDKRAPAFYTITFRKGDEGLWYITSEDEPALFMALPNLEALIKDLPNVLMLGFSRSGVLPEPPAITGGG